MGAGPSDRDIDRRLRPLRRHPDRRLPVGVPVAPWRFVPAADADAVIASGVRVVTATFRRWGPRQQQIVDGPAQSAVALRAVMLVVIDPREPGLLAGGGSVRYYDRGELVATANVRYGGPGHLVRA